MKTAFVNTLMSLAQKDKDIVLLTGDLGFKLFDEFRLKYPKQFINVGVAEPLMVSVAAGLALEGKRPFVYSLASFLTMRAFEQIRNDVCFHQAPVVLVGAGGGLSYGANGPSHHALNDVALMRSLPQAAVFTPADAQETSWSVHQAYQTSGPSYIRLSRSEKVGTDTTFRKVGTDTTYCDIAILVSGFILPQASWAAEELAKQGYSVRLANFPQIKPLPKERIRQIFELCGCVFTVEEHFFIGGFSSAVMEAAVAQQWPRQKFCPITATEQIIHESGSYEYLLSCYGLSREQILQRMETFIKEKALVKVGTDTTF